MKLKFVCVTSYAIGNKKFNYGDTIEVDDDYYINKFPHLFKEVEEKSLFTKKDLQDKTVKDLKKIAKQYNIKIKSKWLKAELINYLYKKLN